MKLQLWEVTGTITYIQACPNVTEVERYCEPIAGCEGHPAKVTIPATLVQAPDEKRAEFVALKKLASAYPYPLFDNGDLCIDLVDPPGLRLPGFMRPPRGRFTRLTVDKETNTLNVDLGTGEILDDEGDEGENDTD